MLPDRVDSGATEPMLAQAFLEALQRGTVEHRECGEALLHVHSELPGNRAGDVDKSALKIIGFHPDFFSFEIRA